MCVCVCECWPFVCTCIDTHDMQIVRVLQCAALCFSVLQHIAVYCGVCTSMDMLVVRMCTCACVSVWIMSDGVYKRLFISVQVCLCVCVGPLYVCVRICLLCVCVYVGAFQRQSPSVPTKSRLRIGWHRILRLF